MMKVADLIKEFAVRESLPVDVNDIVDCLRSNGVEAEIEFIGVELDTDVLQGHYKDFHVRRVLYGQEVTRYVNIYYHRGHSIAWQRFVCAKELIHVLDPPESYTSGPEDIELLAEKIGLPPEMQDPIKDGREANIDRLAEWRALALLFPLAVRDQLLEPYRTGKIKLSDIAMLVDIPSRYVGFVMHQTWEPLHDLLIAG